MVGDMYKMTVYLTEELKKALHQRAQAKRCSESELIREAVRLLVARTAAAKPRALFASNNPGLAERVNEELVGFGER